MIANRMKPALVAAALLAALATDTLARDRWQGYGHASGGHYGNYHGHGGHFGRNRLSMLSDRSLGGASRVSTSGRAGSAERGSIRRLGQIGIVSGGSVSYIDGSLDISLDPSYPGEDASKATYIAPRAKVIDVTEAMAAGNFTAVNGCAYEMGVCIIRGGN
jgi:hypothetical protein